MGALARESIAGVVTPRLPVFGREGVVGKSYDVVLVVGISGADVVACIGGLLF